MSAAKRNAKSKPTKSSKKLKEADGCSRVGSDYQVDVPDFVYNRSSSYMNECSNREVNVWNPDCCPPSPDMDNYLSEAKKHKYSQEAARTFLHYHKYNLQQAIDDLPNFQPVLNTYNKLEVRRFLKCVDSRPRKNFVNVRQLFPAYRMGELHGLYYAIAAPFKAIPRHNRKHGRQMQSCYEKAVKRGFTASTVVPIPVTPVEPDPDDVEADASFERYLCETLGQERASKLVAGVRCGRSTINSASVTASNSAAIPVRVPLGGIANGALPFGRRYTTAATESLIGGSDHSSALDCHSKVNKRSLPPGLSFEYEQFKEFVEASPEDLKQQQRNSKAALLTLENDLEVRTELVESQNKHIFEGLDAFLPDKGFSTITFRWTKSELALLVMALNEFGKDFVKIARILGSKSESLIRDFYNKYNDRFGLDAFVNKENRKSEELSETSVEHLETENTHPPSRESVVSAAVNLDVAAMNRDPETEAPLTNGELEESSKVSTPELEPPFIVTTPSKRGNVLSSLLEPFDQNPTATNKTETDTSVPLRSHPIVSLTPIDRHSASEASSSLKDECNQNENTISKTDSGVEKIKEEVEKEECQEVKVKSEEQESEEDKSPPPTRGQKRAALKTLTRLSISKRLRSRRSFEEDGEEETTPRRLRTSNAAFTFTTGDSPKSRTQRRRGSTEKVDIKTVHQTRSKKHNHEMEPTKRSTKRGGERRQRQLNESAIEGSGKKKRKVEVVEPTISTRRRTSLPSLPPNSSKKRTRISTAATTTASLRATNRKSR